MIAIVNEEIHFGKVIAAVESGSCGGIVSFQGTVRNNSKGKTVIRLEYEAYAEMAVKKMQQVAEEAKERWPVEKIAIVHRTGNLTIGETAVAIAVSSPHRAEAFAACQYCIDRIKEIVPIWKKEFTADGGVWVSPNP